MVETAINKKIYKHFFCNHIKEKYSDSYHPIINPFNLNTDFYNIYLSKLYNPGRCNYRLNSVNTNINIIKNNCYKNNYLSNLFLLNNLDYSWIAFHNSYSLNHQIPASSEGCIFHIEFTNAGDFMLSSNHYNTVDIWDLNSKRLFKTIKPHREIVTAIEFFSYNTYSNVFNLDYYKNCSYSDKDTDVDINIENEANDVYNGLNEYMLTCSLDKTIKLSKNFKVIKEYTAHNDWIRCIAVNNSKKNFLSGCISSVIKYWDFEKGSIILTVDNPPSNNETLNTVNSVKFLDNNESIFLTAYRDGYIRIYDVRTRSKGSNLNNSNNNSSIMPVQAFKAHNNKLNCGKLSKSNNYILTSGRDSLGRLWDFRNLPIDSKEALDKNEIDKSKVITQYKGHKCSGFNIEIFYYNKENNVITGSEDGSIYIYDLFSGKLIKKYYTELNCINIAKPLPNSRSDLGFIYSGLENLKIIVCEPRLLSGLYNDTFYDNQNLNNYNNNTTDNKNCNNKFYNSTNNPNFYDCISVDNYNLKNNNYIALTKTSSNSTSTQGNSFANRLEMSKVIEEIMNENGDIILKLLHTSNIQSSNDLNMETILDILQQDNNAQSQELLNKLNKKIQEKMLEQMKKFIETNTPEYKKKMNEEKIKNIEQERNTIEDVLIQCEDCSLEDDIIMPISNMP